MKYIDAETVTADAFWLRHKDFQFGIRLMATPYALWGNFTDNKDDCIPAWSLSALWDMVPPDMRGYLHTNKDSAGFIDELVKFHCETYVPEDKRKELLKKITNY